MLAVHNKWVRAVHDVDLIEAKNNVFFKQLPFEVAQTPDPKQLVHLWRGILSFLSRSSADISIENKIYLEDLKKYTGHRLKDNRKLLAQLPWLKFLTVVSDEDQNGERWIKARSPIVTMGFNAKNLSIFSIQLHSECKNLFGFVEGGDFTLIDPTQYVGLRSKGMIEFYERCASFANINKPWIASRDEILRMFGFNEEDDPVKYKKYREWRLLRALLTKKAKQLEPKGLSVRIEKINSSHKDEGGAVQVIPIKSSRINIETKVSKLNRTEEKGKHPEDLNSLIDLVSIIDKSASERLKVKLSKFDGLVVKNLIEKIKGQYKFSDKSIFSYSKKEGWKEKSIGHLFGTVNNQTSGAKKKDATEPMEQTDTDYLDQAKEVYFEMLIEWTESLVAELNISKDDIDKQIAKEKDFSIVPYHVQERHAKEKLTKSEEKLLSNMGCISPEEAQQKLAVKLKLESEKNE